MAKLRSASELKAAFGEDDLGDWITAIETQVPDAPTQAECMTAPEVTSFNGKGRRLGAILRFKLHDGQTVTLSLNPVVAKSLIDTLAQTGQAAGWLHKDGHITFPIADE